MPDTNQINSILDNVVSGLLQLKQALNTDAPVRPQIVEPAAPPEQTARKALGPRTSLTGPPESGSFDSLRESLLSDRWPEAVNPNLICDRESEHEKDDRARGIVELMIDKGVDGKKFLDMGCGEGHCVVVASETAAAAVGYDNVPHKEWESLAAKGKNPVLTSDFEEVKAKGPYDVVMIYDVMDHLTGEPPAEFLKKAKAVLKDDGEIYVRFHPFIARHGSHHYRQLNKAYVHLVFTPEELPMVMDDPTTEPNQRVLYPIKTYTDWASAAGLTVARRQDQTEPVEPFFKSPKIAERILKNTGMGQFPEFQMSLQFVEMVLKKV